MPCPKGTRSKGVNKAFHAASTARNKLLTKKDRAAAYVAKEAFMKQAMARHLAAANATLAASVAPIASNDDNEAATTNDDEESRRMDDEAPNSEGAAAQLASTGLDVDAAVDAAIQKALRTHQNATPSGSTVTYAERTSASVIEAKRLAKRTHVATLKSKIGTTAEGERYLAGALKYDGKGGKKKGGRAGADGASEKETKIGHLMRPLRGDEMDFAVQVDTNAKLPKYAQGKMTVVKKRKKNKKRNAREARGG